MRRYRNTILISVLLFIALIFSSCVPRLNLFTVEVVSEPDAISVALLKDIEQANYEASDVQKTPLVLNLKPQETVVVKVIEEEPLEETEVIHVFDGWADESKANPRAITADSNKKLEIKTVKNVRVSISTSPRNLVEIAGSGFYPVDTELDLTAPAEVGDYHFSYWNIDGSREYSQELSLKLDGPTKIEAVYENRPLRSFEIDSQPSGLNMSVDGQEILTPYTIKLEDGESHTVAFLPQERDLSNLVNGTDTRYFFKSWSDGGTSNPRTVLLNTDLSLNAITGIEYLTVTSTVPEGIGKFSSAAWKTAGSSVSFVAPEVPGYIFSHWEIDGEAVLTEELSVIVDSPKSVVANYSLVGHELSLDTDPSGLEILINDKTFTSPASLSGSYGDLFTVEIPEPQTRDESEFVIGIDARYTFGRWNDSIETNKRTIKLDSDKSYTSTMEIEYLVETDTMPEGLSEIPGAGWKAKGSFISYESSDLIEYTFSHWEVNGERVDGEILDLVVERPMKIIAVYKNKKESTLEIASNPEGLVFSLNSEVYSAPKSFVFESGTSIGVSFPASQEKDNSEQVSGNDTRFLFSKWADGLAENTRTFELTEDTRLEATANTEYLVEVSSETAQIAGTGWYRKGYSLNITAPEVSGYRFVSWSVNGTKAVGNPLSVTVDSPKKIVAVYEEAVVSNKTLTVSTTPEGLLVKIDGNQMVSPYQITAAEGSSHAISTITPQEKDISTQIVGNDVRYDFSGWNDGSTVTTRTIELNSNLSFVAAFGKEFKLEAVTQPFGIVQIGGAGWYRDGEKVVLNVVAVEGYNFLHWSVNGVKAGESSTLEFIIDEPTVAQAVYNSLPTISLEDREVSKGGVLELLLSEHSADADGDTLSYSLLSGPGSISGGIYSVDTSELNAGVHEITIEVSDGRGGYAADGFTITVTEQNNPPAVPGSPSPASGSVDQELSIELSWTCSDSDGDALVFDIYFGSSSSPEKVASDIVANNWQSGDLSEGVTYYWKIVAKDSKGATSESSVWSFSTKNSLPADGVDKVGPVYLGNLLLISNENPDCYSYENTGSLSEDFVQTASLPDALPLEAYAMNPILPEPDGLTLDKLVKLGDNFEIAAVGSTSEFWVYNFKTNTTEKLTATLQYSGSKSEIWVENTEEIGQQQAQQLGSEFDDSIYPLIANYFYTPSDLDGNGKVKILCFDIQDNFETTGSYYAGYFSSGDLFNHSISNMGELFYIDTYPSMHYPKTNPIDVSRAFSTIAHEFQHMVNYNRNVLVEKGSTMPTWLNEGLSLAAEHLYSGVLSRRISYFNSSPRIRDGHSVLYWGDNGDTLSSYALSYIFLQYIRAQAGNDAIFRDILLSNDNSSNVIVSALTKYGVTKSLGEILTDFRIALVLKNGSGPYGFRGDGDFNSIAVQFYSGGSKDLRGGSAVYKSINPSFTDPGNSGSSIQYVGICN
ncbi:hypothetical protein Y696_12640 [Mesotoga sp. H07pep.5.4]|uniref:InlB B-repeat-containing protein n=1 Tax=Mesotoga sp. H07pep.5.4 TaxID=1463664 RepID=UPI000EF13D22|nr:hypothetical protein [Mesotoga sp. H07pep.5.4]RLL88108.1 hypothetical protein Y696_12640 [Mesotoga sp. H07pep.5.4]